MPFLDTDNDNYSLPSEINSDDDSEESYCDTHRSCSRYASCNKKNHLHSLTDSTTVKSLSKNSTKPIKGDIRSIDSGIGHRQKYDGSKWRRICCSPDCLLYLTGGIYFKKWLCRKHYLLTHVAKNVSNKSVNSTIEDITPIISENQNSQKSSTRPISKQNGSPKRGDLMVDANGIRQKYDGRSWRPVCNYKNCISFIVRHGYCHRHDMEIRNKKSKILPKSDNNQQKKSSIKSQTKRAQSSSIKKPQKGDIQLIRQLWNGTKWYSLCHYHTGDCRRRSTGKRHGYLCDTHYKEYLKQRKDQNLIAHTDQVLLSPTVKRKKIINYDDIPASNIIDQQNPATSHQSNSTIERIKHTEQCIQTDLTYPLESNDLRQGCFLIDDDDNDQSQLMVRIKKEEEDFIIQKRKLTINVNSLPINCKIELTKIEL